MDFIKVLIPFKELISNNNVNQLALSALMGGAKVAETVNNITTYTNIKNNNTTYKLLTYDAMAYIVSIGGDILNYNSYIKVNPADNVPSYIKDSVIINKSETGEEIVTILTWQEWIHSNNSFIQIADDYYISSHAHYAGYKISEKHLKGLKGSELTQLRMNGYTVINQEELKSLLNTTYG